MERFSRHEPAARGGSDAFTRARPDMNVLVENQHDVFSVSRATSLQKTRPHVPWENDGAEIKQSIHLIDQIMDKMKKSLESVSQ